MLDAQKRLEMLDAYQNREGWSIPEYYAKSHYYRGARALCGRRDPTKDGGAILERVSTGRKAGPNDCSICWRLKRKEKTR